MHNRHVPFLDLVALLLSVLVTGVVAICAAWWYGIAWQDITSAGAFGPPFYAFIFGCFVGLPAYYVSRYLRARRYWTAPTPPTGNRDP